MSQYRKLSYGDSSPFEKDTGNFLLRNLFPFRVKVLILRKGSTKYEELTTLDYREKKIVNNIPNESLISPLDIENQKLLSPPVNTNDTTTFTFGGTSWTFGNTNIFTTSDIISINIINHLSLSILVKYFGSCHSQLEREEVLDTFIIQRRDDEGRMGGSSSFKVFDFKGNGLNVGDRFRVYIEHPTSLPKTYIYLYDFYIPCKYSKNIHVGVINRK